MDAVDRAAQAAYAIWRIGRVLPPWEELPDHRREVWRRIAAAVLATMAERRAA
jgi:hypothetical protein